MITKSKPANWQRCARVAVSLVALLSNNLNAFGQSSRTDDAKHEKTATPIKHIIVLIGENRTFDHLFATFVPRKGETVSNLLSKGIINADGTPGPNFAQAQQFQAVAPFRTEYFISLRNEEKAPYNILPAPTLNFAPTTPFFSPGTPTSLLAAVEPFLESQDLKLLITGAATGFSQTCVLPDPIRASKISTTFRTDLSRFEDLSCPTIPIPGIQRTGCSRCGNNQIALLLTPQAASRCPTLGNRVQYPHSECRV
jgi:hypothetical protein